MTSSTWIFLSQAKRSIHAGITCRPDDGLASFRPSVFRSIVGVLLPELLPGPLVLVLVGAGERLLSIPANKTSFPIGVCGVS